MRRSGFRHGLRPEGPAIHESSASANVTFCRTAAVIESLLLTVHDECYYSYHSACWPLRRDAQHGIDSPPSHQNFYRIGVRQSHWLSLPPSFLMFPSLLVAGAVALLLYSLIYLRNQRVRRLPGPPRWPIIGNLLDIPRKDGHVKYAEWGRVYGAPSVPLLMTSHTQSCSRSNH